MFLPFFAYILDMFSSFRFCYSRHGRKGVLPEKDKALLLLPPAVRNDARLDRQRLQALLELRRLRPLPSDLLRRQSLQLLAGRVRSIGHSRLRTTKQAIRRQPPSLSLPPHPPVHTGPHLHRRQRRNTHLHRVAILPGRERVTSGLDGRRVQEILELLRVHPLLGDMWSKRRLLLWKWILREQRFIQL